MLSVPDEALQHCWQVREHVVRQDAGRGEIAAGGDTGQHQHGHQTCVVRGGDVGVQAIADHHDLAGLAMKVLDRLEHHQRFRLPDDHRRFSAGFLDSGDDRAGPWLVAVLVRQAVIDIRGDERGAMLDGLDGALHLLVVETTIEPGHDDLSLGRGLVVRQDAELRAVREDLGQRRLANGQDDGIVRDIGVVLNEVTCCRGGCLDVLDADLDAHLLQAIDKRLRRRGGVVGGQQERDIAQPQGVEDIIDAGEQL